MKALSDSESKRGMVLCVIQIPGCGIGIGRPPMCV
jgi:hypothetical protein